jgi:hypothetical protein
MLARTHRYLLIIALLVAGAIVTWLQRSEVLEIPTALSVPGSGQTDASELPGHVYFMDVEGWYRVTPYEAAVRSHYDLSGDTTEALAHALPARLSGWQQVGLDRGITDDPGVSLYLKQPTVGLQRTYQDSAGQKLTLVIIGNKGEDSFLLFSHTPETCYPGRLWEVVENRLESAWLGERPVYARYLLTQHAETGQKLMVLFWYLWGSPERDSQDGVLSIRVNLPVSPEAAEEQVLARAWDFVRALFPTTAPWERF